MKIFVDISNTALCAKILDVLVRAGHAIERGALGATSVFDLALVGTPEAAEKLRRARPAAAIIVVTRIGDVPSRVRALESGADDAFDGSFPPAQIAGRPRRAVEASMLAPTKHVLEMPMLRAVMPIDVEADTRQNLELHARLQAMFPTTWSADQMVTWIYRDIFLMPPDDPALGLDIEEPFLAQ